MKNTDKLIGQNYKSCNSDAMLEKPQHSLFTLLKCYQMAGTDLGMCLVFFQANQQKQQYLTMVS